MKLLLVGVQDFNFSTDDGKIDGVKIHYMEAFREEETNSFGHKPGGKFVARDLFDSFKVNLQELVNHLNTEIDVDFNDKGKVTGIYVPQAKKGEK